MPHRHRLDLVVRHVDRRHRKPLLQLDELGARLHTKLRIEVRERLVHQVDLRVPNDRTPHRDPLALTAGEVPRLTVEVRLEIEELRRLEYALPSFFLRDAL